MALAPRLAAQTVTSPTDTQPPPVATPAAATAVPMAPYAPSPSPPPTAQPGFPPPPAGYQYVRLPSASPPAQEPASPSEYEDGDPIPPGYRVRELPRRGLLTAGYIVTAIPYGISAMAALSANFQNQSGYLLIPFIGPWMTIGRRSYADCDNGEDTRRNGTCALDVLVVIGVAMDGVMQVAGGTLLLTGYLATTKKLVRSDVSLTLRPQVIGTGYGLGASGTF